MPLIYLIAGEESGDVLGSRLMRAIKARRPDITFAGIGGSAMAEQGLASLFPIRALSLMGLIEILPRLVGLRARLKQTVADIKARAPDVLVTIDSPGFTLRVLRALKQTSPRRIHYVAPQVWAWRENRVRRFPGLWDELLCLLPFEPAFFSRHHLAARFVGHPVLESGADAGDGERFRSRHGIDPEATVVTLLPGSRRTEVARLLPVFEATMKLLPHRVIPVVPLAGPVADVVRRHSAGWPTPPVLVSDAGDKYDAFAASSAALTKSGTSALELALANVPMVVTYRVHPITYEFAKRMFQVKYVSLPNLLLDRPLVPELLQAECNPKHLAAELNRLLADPAAGAAQRLGFAEAMNMLRPPSGSPSECAAEAVLSMLR